jgi:hypothetical protein
MNGRVYDSWLGRFLSPDPFVQSPGFSQSYNRYSYCLNNPLRYTDPSGYTYKPDDWDMKPIISAPYFGPGYGGYIGPGSGDHWSDGMNSYRDYVFMGSISFDNYYGSGAYDIACKFDSNPATQQDWRSGNISMQEVMDYNRYWNPIMGEEAYRESEYKNGVQYVYIYCYGAWVSFANNVANGGGDGYIPHSIGLDDGSSVRVTFSNTRDGSSSDNPINQNAVNALSRALNIANNTARINSINISATTNGTHAANSLHYSGQAIDINQVNGVRLAIQGASPSVIAIQNALSTDKTVIENKGPYIGSDPSHLNHIHFGVNP